MMDVHGSRSIAWALALLAPPPCHKPMIDGLDKASTKLCVRDPFHIFRSKPDPKLGFYVSTKWPVILPKILF